MGNRLKVQIPGLWPQPCSTAWAVVRPFHMPGTRHSVGAVYESRGVLVISTQVVAEYPSGVGEGPQDHVSVSRRGHRAPQRDIDRALQAFGMVGTEEDNHHPGIARHFWRPVDPAHWALCQCKTSEVVMVDPRDGYTWTNPAIGQGECRGCEYARLIGRWRPQTTCPVHGEVPHG